MNEEEVKLRLITPSLENAGWDRNTQIKMEFPITAGRIIVSGNKGYRDKNSKRFADYLLSYKDNIPLAIVEAKADLHRLGDGLNQAQDYAKKLDVRFVFVSNGKDGFLFYDMKTGEQKIISLDEFPSPETLFNTRYKEEIDANANFNKILSTPYYFGEGSYSPRYYQRIAINKTVEAVSNGQDRVLLVMATGTGKTYVAFQIIWRLWKSGIKKKILYLADRNILVDQTVIGDFKPFKNNMVKITHKNMDTSYEIYLALYQQLSENGTEDSLALLKNSFKPNFFDLIIVDECHRGSAREDSNWRKILDYFEPATKIGMTATPKETKNVSNIDYFGEPIYTYSLKNGIEDGFLAPYKVIRYAIDTDVYGWRPEVGEIDKNGLLIDDREYGIKDFDRTMVIDERTWMVAKKITEYLKDTDRYAKTIVFCVDIDHAERMRYCLTALNRDLCAIDYRYIMRITGDNDEGKRQLDNFIDDDSKYPTIVTTSKLMTTGVNCQTCKVIVLDNIFGEDGMSEFKQIIGRGTRIKEEYNKLFFTILDFREATRLFADPNFNGPVVQEEDYKPCQPRTGTLAVPSIENSEILPTKKEEKKFYVNGVTVTILAEKVQYYGEDGKLVTQSIKDYSKKNMLQEYATLDDFLNLWNSNERHAVIIDELEKQGIFIEALRDLYPADVDDFDLICDIAYGVKPLTKSERAKKSKVDEILQQYSDQCKEVLKIILEKYSDNDIDDLTDINILKLPEFNDYGNPRKITNMFGGKTEYIHAVQDIQRALYTI